MSGEPGVDNGRRISGGGRNVEKVGWLRCGGSWVRWGQRMEVGSGGQRRVATICCPGGGRRGDGGSLPVPTTGLPPSHRPRIDATVGFHQHHLKLNLIKLFNCHFSPVCQNMAKKNFVLREKGNFGNKISLIFTDWVFSTQSVPFLFAPKIYQNLQQTLVGFCWEITPSIPNPFTGCI